MDKYIGEKDYEHGSKEKIGVLITNLGTPDAPNRKELKVYLNQFLSDPRVIELPKILWQILLKKWNQLKILMAGFVALDMELTKILQKKMFIYL